MWQLIKLDEYILKFIEKLQSWQAFIILILLIAPTIIRVFVPSQELKIIKENLIFYRDKIDNKLEKLIKKITDLTSVLSER